MGKKILSLILVALLCVSLFAGCGNTEKSDDAQKDEQKEVATEDKDNSSADDEEAVELIYYTIGTPPADLEMVTEELSEMTMEKINAKVNLKFIDWGDYGSKITAIINSGEEYDLAFAAGPDQGDYLGNSKKGAFEPLDDLLEEYGQGILEAVNPGFWEGVKIDGKIYGIPTNKEIATPQWWMYPKELVDKYDIDIDSIKTLEDLEPWLEKLSKEEPEWQLMELDQESHFHPGYEYIIDDSVPAVASLNDDSLKVKNLYEEESTIEILNTLRKYYKAGYINQDAAIKPPAGLVEGEKVFWAQAQGGPYSDIIWSKNRGYTIVASQVEDAYVTTESTRGSIVCVSSNSKHKEKAVEFLNLVNTDADIRNTLGYGVEGVHYEVVDGKAKFLDASSNYDVPNYSLGNRLIMYPTVEDPDDLWEEYERFNEDSVESPMLGFTPDLDPIKNEIAAITNVTKEFRPALMTGSVDVEENLEKFNEKLKEAGLDKVIETLQSQLDDWKANK